jgi:hypothetical protein
VHIDNVEDLRHDDSSCVSEIEHILVLKNKEQELIRREPHPEPPEERTAEHRSRDYGSGPSAQRLWNYMEPTETLTLNDHQKLLPEEEGTGNQVLHINSVHADTTGTGGHASKPASLDGFEVPL